MMMSGSQTSVIGPDHTIVVDLSSNVDNAQSGTAAPDAVVNDMTAINPKADDTIVAQDVSASSLAQETDQTDTPAAGKPNIGPIYYDLQPSATAESTLIDRVNEERKKQLNRVKRFSSPSDVSSPLKFPIPQVTETTILGARRAAVRPGFVTGFDIKSQEEEQRRQARIARFGPPKSHPFCQPDDAALARAIRFHPDSFPDDPLQTSSSLLERCRNVSSSEEPRPNVLHLYGVDQLRTDEIIKHFSPYGPSWCEWLNDSSCNIVFEDEFTLQRVFRGMSLPMKFREMPSQSEKTKTGSEISSMVKTEAEVQLDEMDTSPVNGGPDGSFLKWRRLRPVLRYGQTLPLWGRLATTIDKRPEKPNPDSKWSRTVKRVKGGRGDSRISGQSKSDRGSLGVRKDRNTIRKRILSKKSSKMNTDR